LTSRFRPSDLGFAFLATQSFFESLKGMSEARAALERYVEIAASLPEKLTVQLGAG
jgi:hypothetical protein